MTLVDLKLFVVVVAAAAVIVVAVVEEGVVLGKQDSVAEFVAAVVVVDLVLGP
jgi:hypothetical protein